MARVTVEDCVDKVENRFELILVASTGLARFWPVAARAQQAERTRRIGAITTAGAISDAVLPQLAVGARVVICGTASGRVGIHLRADRGSSGTSQAGANVRSSRARLSASIRRGHHAIGRLGS